MSTGPGPLATLDLFDDLAADVMDALAGLDDWGLSGAKTGQYVHDVVADELIVPRLLEAGFRVLTEESGIVGEGTVTVVVDPVDGSTNASHGIPWYATSLCSVDEDGPLVAAVVNLDSGQRFRAIRGEGVEIDSEHAQPSSCVELADAIIGFSGWPPAHGGWRQYRSLGACALDLCAVAVGGLDAFVDVVSGHGVWDYLGALLVCREAGVPVVDADERDLVVLDPSARRAPVAAATAELLDQVLSMRAGWVGALKD